MTNRERMLMQSAVASGVGGVVLLIAGALIPAIPGGICAGTGLALIIVAVHFVKEATR
jgi:hypothetical protein